MFNHLIRLGFLRLRLSGVDRKLVNQFIISLNGFTKKERRKTQHRDKRLASPNVIDKCYCYTH